MGESSRVPRGGDFLLIYRLAVNGKGKSETVYFTRTGTHADLFESMSEITRRDLRSRQYQ